MAPAIPQDIVQRAIELRHDLHRIPELSFEEVKTAQLVRDELCRLDIPFTAGVADAPTATIAHVGDERLPCVALRADIDALPIVEATGVPYASTHPGRMHACGHDGHTACLLGAAAALKRMERDLRVCVKLIFQPAEEGGGGAKRLCDAGVLDGRVGPRPQRIFGLHGRPALPLGMVSTRPGPLMAATARFRAIFRGRGGHGAYPHLTRDPIVAASHGVIALQQVVSREINPVDSVVITVGQIAGGSAVNIIPETAQIDATVRTLSAQVAEDVRKRIERVLNGIALAGNVTLEFSWQDGYPSTSNDPAAAAYARDVVGKTFGPGAFMEAPSPVMGGEDFAYYLQAIPGCFMFLGLRAPDERRDPLPVLHHPQFNFSDAAVEHGIRLHVALALHHA